jgi:small-conductance mechanosensitive channel
MSDIKLNVVRTSKDKIFDIVFLVLTLTIWGIIIWLISRAPDIVPTHFGPPGKPDAYGSPTFILIPTVIMTVMAFICAFGVYFPFGSVNLPFVEGPGNERQKKLGVLLSRIIGIMILGIMLFIAIYSLAMKDHSSILPVVIIVGSLIGVSIVFTIMMYRAK